MTYPIDNICVCITFQFRVSRRTEHCQCQKYEKIEFDYGLWVQAPSFIHYLNIQLKHSLCVLGMCAEMVL